MEAVIRKWGNSLGIRIPNAIAKELSLKDGSFVDIEDDKEKIVIKPKKKIVLNDLLDGVDKFNLHKEIDIKGPVGNEIW